MITDALWSDFDNDGKADLIVCGEWMPVTFLKNTGDGFVSLKSSSGIDQHTGWWNSLAAGDFDSDGDMDYIAGNLGLNSTYKATFKEPMTVIAKDRDGNGSMDPMIFCYMKAEDGTQKPFPMHTRNDLIRQLISVRREYPTFKSYGKATMDDVWKKQDRNGAIIMKATDLTSSYIENLGNGKFKIKPLPLEAQTAPLYGMVSMDVDHDGNLDVLLVGNDFGMDPLSGRHDAFNGLCLMGNGKGGFSSTAIGKSGFLVKGDGKGLSVIHAAKGGDLIIASQNQDSIKVYAKAASGSAVKWISLNPEDFCADLFYVGNKKRHLEFYYGNTYLSQSSRKVALEKDFVKMVVTDFRGNTREILNNNKQ